LESKAAYVIRRAHQRASALFLARFGESQLTPTQYFAMARLLEIGPLSQNRLGRLAAMDPATIQGVIRRLVERGLIERLPDPNDRRRMTLTLTPEGESLISSLAQTAEVVDEEILKPLSDEERQTFLRLLKKLA
jgi:DNA-binding MarR family transcriptional regulator